MKFQTLILAEHVTITNGLLNMLGGGPTKLHRPIFPAPIGLFLVCVIELPTDYQSESIPLNFLVTSADGSEVYARTEGEFQAILMDDAVGLGATSPIVVDLNAVLLPKAGTFRIRGHIGDYEPADLYFQVTTEPITNPVEAGPGQERPDTNF